LIDEIRIDIGSRRVIECISNYIPSITHNYLIDTKQSGLYEIKVYSTRPTSGIDELKDDLVAQYNTLAIYYQKANLIEPNSCPNFYRFKVYPMMDG
jgi:hypothetical protein